MSLPEGFQFSQSSLQDFETCARRFKLRYLEQLSWPAVESEPVQEAERLAQLGADFHRLVQQHLIGLDEALLTETLAGAEPELKAWWQNYLLHRPGVLAEAQIYPELTLSTPLRGYRLLARYDLLAAGEDGTFLIVDWKTAKRRPGREYLARRSQTRVYPYVLVKAGAAFNGGQPIDPASVKMMYWYPETPERPELFEYSFRLQKRDEEYLSDLVERIKTADHNDNFPLVEEEQPCRYCVYRSYCDRGERAGPVEELSEAPPDRLDVSALDWDQIAGIEF